MKPRGGGNVRSSNKQGRTARALQNCAGDRQLTMRVMASLSTAVFGIDLDGPTYPDVPDGLAAAAGQAVLGPAGLVAAVEQSLGLTGPQISAARRLAVWRAKVAAACEQPRFFKKSFETDPLATSRSLLAWRDVLIAAGWTPTRIENAPPRLVDLAAIETTGQAMLPGHADRLIAAIAGLRARGPTTPIERLRLLDRRDLLPLGLARLIDALQAAGTVVEDLAPPEAGATGDLHAVQQALRDGTQPPLKGDHSFAVLAADSELAAAEVLADWLAVAAKDQGETVIIAERSTAALDAALRRRHLPRLGIGTASPLRGVLQVLPLALALQWRPFDPLRALELLQLPGGPIPGDLARPLARALAETPGRGGQFWAEAIEQGWKSYEARLAAEGDAAKAAQRTKRARDRFDILLQGPLIDPAKGIDADAAVRLGSQLSSWAMARAERGDDLAEVLAGACSDFVLTVRDTEQKSLSRIEIERLVDSVLADGIEDLKLTAEAAPWSAVRKPAAVWGPADTVIWWTVAMPGLPGRLPWSQAELAALAQAGCAPTDPAKALSLADATWRRPLFSARRRVLLIVVGAGLSGGAAERGETHPIMHELRPLLSAAAPGVVARAETLLGDPKASLLGMALPRGDIASRALPVGRRDWTLPAGISINRVRESASSVEAMLGCPYSWVAQYLFGLSPGRRAEIPDGEQLAGTLAHRLAQLLLKPGVPEKSEVLAEEARQRLPKLLEEEAAPLLASGLSAERARVLDLLPQAIGELARRLGDLGVVIEGTEVERSASEMPEPGRAFGGKLDLLLRRGDQPVVLDLKWSRTERWRRKQLEDGHAVQLAAYAQLVGAGENAAYFMLAQRRLLALKGGIIEASLEGASLADTWTRARESHRARVAALSKGTLRALGVEPDASADPDGASLAPEAPCRFCQLGRLCGQGAAT
ncbi:MAG: PD-(D/E)XK nuclease family protein [Planctomycetes bacterium]|nr:PD-(D/E)XK nuclease family protein [Planctomycetota bacterium]